jgi:phage-related minor tail protein
VLRSLALALSSHALEAALAPITSVLGKSVAGLFGTALKVPFASGGVIASPVAFPLGGTRHVGIAGEAGPEAILPLSRGADGRLGVRARAAARHSTLPSMSPRQTRKASAARKDRRGHAEQGGRPGRAESMNAKIFSAPPCGGGTRALGARRGVRGESI